MGNRQFEDEVKLTLAVIASPLDPCGTQRAFGKCFTQARVRQAAERGAADPPWRPPLISPRELGHIR